MATKSWGKRRLIFSIAASTRGRSPRRRIPALSVRQRRRTSSLLKRSSASPSVNPQCGQDAAARWIRWTHRGHFMVKKEAFFYGRCRISSKRILKKGEIIGPKHLQFPPDFQGYQSPEGR